MYPEPSTVSLEPLSFLAGSRAGTGVVFAGVPQPTFVHVVEHGFWQPPMRYLHYEVVALMDGAPWVHFDCMVTFSQADQRHCCWLFASLLSNPIRMEGGPDGSGKYVFQGPVCDPAVGFEMARATVSPTQTGVEVLGEIYEHQAWFSMFEFHTENAESP